MKINYKGKVLKKVNLHAKASGSITWHIELLCKEVNYEAGDTIGIVPPNNKTAVAEIIALTGVNAAEEVTLKSETATINDWLSNKLTINYLHVTVLKKYAHLINITVPEQNIDLIQLLKAYPLADSKQFVEVLKILNRQTARLYNVASSLTTHSGAVHITVAKEEFEINGEIKLGLCSAYFEDIKENDTIDFFVQRNKRFRLPATDKDIIMVGYATGIAPFRAFLWERAAKGATGRNWLFFGEEQVATAYLYQSEIQGWNQAGVLTKLSVAFTQEQTNENSLLDKLRDEAEELYNWMDNGAYLYLCGQKSIMGVAEKTLVEIIALQQKTDWEEALKVFNKWKEEGRYFKEVY